MAEALGGTFGLRFVDLDMADEFGGVFLRFESRAVAAQGLGADDADDTADGDERTHVGVSTRPVADQAFEAFAGRAFAGTLGDHAAGEDHERTAGCRRGVETQRAETQAARRRLGEVEFGDDVGEDREGVAMRRGAPAPALAGEVEARRSRPDLVGTLRGASGGRHHAGRTHETGQRPAVPEGTQSDLLHVPLPFLGCRTHLFGRGLPDFLGLGVLGETGEHAPRDLLERKILRLRQRASGQAKAEDGGAHEAMTARRERLSSDYALGARGNGAVATKAGISAEARISPTASGKPARNSPAGSILPPGRCN